VIADKSSPLTVDDVTAFYHGARKRNGNWTPHQKRDEWHLKTREHSQRPRAQIERSAFTLRELIFDVIESRERIQGDHGAPLAQ
jgi:hypothetical protein